MGIKQIVERPDTRTGRAFDVFIQALIIASLVSFSIETMPNIDDRTKRLLGFAELVLVLIFTAEYITRIIVADRKLKFIFSFYGLVDLGAILPFYLATGLDLRSLRAIRLLRLFRVFKLLRYSAAIRRFHRAFLIIREELVLFFMTSAIMLYLTAVGIYYFENDAQPQKFASVFHGLWWSVCTLTTVGYGDIFPMTVGGKIFTFFTVMIGLGIVAVPTGMFASALAEARKFED